MIRLILKNIAFILTIVVIAFAGKVKASMTVQQMVEFLQARDKNIQSIRLKYAYTKYYGDDYFDFITQYFENQRIIHGKKFSFPNPSKPKSQIREKYYCDYREHGSKYYLEIKDIEHSDNGSGVFTSDGKFCISFNPRLQRGIISNHKKFDIPTYHDFAMSIPYSNKNSNGQLTGIGEFLLTALHDNKLFLSKSDNALTWEGATQDPNDRLKATVPKDVAAKKIVNQN